MTNLGHGRAQCQVAELGGTRDGRIEAYRLTVVQDAGESVVAEEAAEVLEVQVARDPRRR